MLCFFSSLLSFIINTIRPTYIDTGSQLRLLLLDACHCVSLLLLFVYISLDYRVAQKTGPPYFIPNILKFYDRIAWKLVNFCSIIMLNTVINFLFKKFIALWRHLAKTQLLSFIHIVTNRFEHHTVASYVFARWRNSAMKFLNKKLTTVFSI